MIYSSLTGRFFRMGGRHGAETQEGIGSGGKGFSILFRRFKKMNSIQKLAKRFVREEDGIVAVEYALIVAVIAGLVAIALTKMDFNTIYTNVSNKIKGLIV